MERKLPQGHETKIKKETNEINKKEEKKEKEEKNKEEIEEITRNFPFGVLFFVFCLVIFSY